MTANSTDIFTPPTGTALRGFNTEDLSKAKPIENEYLDKGNLTSRQNGNKVKHMVEQYEQHLKEGG